MVIYDALLAEKRILFAGALDCSLSQIQDYVFAAASLVSPPLYGIQNKIFPYVPLSQMPLLESESGFIAGVTNPMFLQNKRCHDLSCRVDESKLNADASFHIAIDFSQATILISCMKVFRANQKVI